MNDQDFLKILDGKKTYSDLMKKERREEMRREEMLWHYRTDIHTQRRFCDDINTLAKITDFIVKSTEEKSDFADRSFVAAIDEIVILRDKLKQVAAFARHHVQDLELAYIKEHGTKEEYDARLEEVAERGSFLDCTGYAEDPAELTPRQILKAYLGELNISEE